MADNSGQVSVTVTAYTVAGGPYDVSAGLSPAEAVSFSLTNTPGDAASVAVISGSGQVAPVGTAFASALVVLVRDTYGNPVPGASVGFTALRPRGPPPFLMSTPAKTGDDGQASVTAMANTVAGGPYTVTASVSGLTASFSLTNTPAAPTSVTIVSGSGQSATVGTAFANPLVVLVRDTYGNPVPGASVGFTAPTSGASATLSASTVTTGDDGRASVTAAANAIGGPYTVTASVDGATSAIFNLTNTYQIVALFDQTMPNNSGSTVPIMIKLTDAQGQNVGSSGLPVTAVSVVGPDGPVPLQ